MRRGSLLVAGLVLLGFAWLFATPPFQPPDEASHYLRALTIDRGRLVGPRVPLDPTGKAWLAQGGWRAQEQRWIDHDRRGVFVASRLSPPGEPCLNDTVDTSGCTEVSYTGDYFPLAFGLPAVAIGVSSTWKPALWLARVASLLPVLLFLALALAYPRRRSGWATLGVLASVTPMVLFIGAALNPSGLEIAAALAFLSGLLALRAEPERFLWWQWFGLVASGVVTILAWQLGLFYAVLYVAVWLMLLGRAGARDLFVAQRSRMLVGIGVLIAAAVVYFGYGLAFGVLHSPLHLTPIGASLRAGRNELTLALRGAIGIFGAYNVALPSPMSQIWLLAAAALLAFAAWRANRRERIVIVLVGAFAVVFPIVFYGFSYRYSGFGLQGRYVLPALILVPMVAGHVLDRHRVSVTGGLGVTLRVAIVAIAAFQLAAWWVNAHHWAASSSALLTHTAWTPPLGWGPLLVAAVAGGLALVAAACQSLDGHGQRVRRPA
jgi:hypothetical protein